MYTDAAICQKHPLYLSTIIMAPDIWWWVSGCLHAQAACIFSETFSRHVFLGTHVHVLVHVHVASVLYTFKNYILKGQIQLELRPPLSQELLLEKVRCTQYLLCMSVKHQLTQDHTYKNATHTCMCCMYIYMPEWAVVRSCSTLRCVYTWVSLF